MPLTTKGAPKRSTRLLWALLMGLLSVALGTVILYLQAERALIRSSQQTAEESIRQFDLMLENTDIAARALLPQVGQTCDEIRQLALREQVTRRPFVRSTNLVWRNDNYCSSLLGTSSATLNPDDYVDGKLWLMNGNPVTPDTALLVYRLSEGERAALATIDGYHLSNALRLISRYADLQLQVGKHWLSSDGKVHDTALPMAPVAPIHLASERFPYSVNAGFPEGDTWLYMKAQYPALFSLLVFFGLLSGMAGYWLQKRSSSPSHELQRALEAAEFIPYFQPVVRGDNQQWAGIEVLMRWKHPKEGLVRPDLFIPFAEHSGLIVPMTRSLMQQTALLLSPHADTFIDKFHIGINITASHCHDFDLLEDCRDFLAMFPPGKVVLVLELTERDLVVPSAVTDSLFEELHKLGVMIAIDDFGTGHSSLGYLRQFNVDYLKIDQSFVAMIGIDALSRHILDSIIELCAKLDLGIVAEGVETTEQGEYLAAQGVEFLQGYLFGRPMPVDEFLHTLAHH